MRLAMLLPILTSALLSLPLQALGQAPAWPSKPIRLICPFPTGGQLDIAARVVTEKIAVSLGQPIIVENRTGADGNIGTEAVAKSAPDGHTWLIQAVPFTVMQSLRPKALRYDPVRDFQPVVMLGTTSLVYVVPADLPVASLKEFVEYARARPGQISYAGSSRGSLAHLSAEMLKSATGIRMEMIGYAGMPPALADLMSGRTHFMSLGVPVALPHVRSGKLKALAVLDEQRHKQLPEVPTVGEAGFPGLATRTWFGILVPAQTPKDAVTRIHAEISRALQASDVMDRYEKAGIDPAKPQRVEDFETFIRDDIARWAKVIKEANIETD